MFDSKNTSNTWRRRGQIVIAVMIALALVSVFSGGGRGSDPDVPDAGTVAPADESSATEADGEFGEFAVVDGEPLTGYIIGQDFAGKEVEYAEIDGLPIFEGDIILGFEGNDPMAAGVAVRGRNPSDFRWPDRVVPYEIHEQLPDQFRVRNAIAHWEANTSMRFVERSAGNANQYPNYIRFQPGMGCSSYVGMRGGMQPINLARGCDIGSTIHEIGHAVGLWHEQSRADRDEHVEIRFENIIPSTIFNFTQHIQDGEDLGPYDYDSIMHYPRWAFSRNGEDTIVPLNGQEIGQREGLSAGDIAAVETIYGR